MGLTFEPSLPPEILSGQSLTSEVFLVRNVSPSFKKAGNVRGSGPGPVFLP